jgi:hypothetical protein
MQNGANQRPCGTTFPIEHVLALSGEAAMDQALWIMPNDSSARDHEEQQDHFYHFMTILDSW